MDIIIIHYTSPLISIRFFSLSKTITKSDNVYNKRDDHLLVAYILTID
jgi:hypothetical protein